MKGAPACNVGTSPAAHAVAKPGDFEGCRTRKVKKISFFQVKHGNLRCAQLYDGLPPEIDFEIYIYIIMFGPPSTFLFSTSSAADPLGW